MGKFLPVFLAFILNSYGVQIFREPTLAGGPLVSLYIFMFATFILLWDQRLYPKSLRKLWPCGQFLVEFLVADFLMEHIMLDFWFPLELALMNMIPRTADFIDGLLRENQWTCDVFCEFFRRHIVVVVSSYFLSIFFLLSVMHATRAIDLRTLECGIGFFFKDIINRLKRNCRKLRRYFGFGKRRVKLSEPNTSSSCPIRPPVCKPSSLKGSCPKQKVSDPFYFEDSEPNCHKYSDYSFDDDGDDCCYEPLSYNG